MVVTPVVTVTGSGAEARLTWEYQDANGIWVELAGPPVNAGHYRVTAYVPGQGAYMSATAVQEFTIAPRKGPGLLLPASVNEADLEGLSHIAVTDGATTLVQGRDYDLVVERSGDTAVVTVTFKGNYAGTFVGTVAVTSEGGSGGGGDTGAGGDGDSDGNGGDAGNTAVREMTMAAIAATTAARAMAAMPTTAATSATAATTATTATTAATTTTAPTAAATAAPATAPARPTAPQPPPRRRVRCLRRETPRLKRRLCSLRSL